jgi:hypothetical protein
MNIAFEDHRLMRIFGGKRVWNDVDRQTNSTLESSRFLHDTRSPKALGSKGLRILRHQISTVFKRLAEWERSFSHQGQEPSNR